MNAPFLPSRARGLIRRLEARQARIGMIGLGYAGFPLALRYAETGFRVTGFDIPRGCLAAYYPECNTLIPVAHHAEESKTPAAKAVPVRISARVPHHSGRSVPAEGLPPG